MAWIQDPQLVLRIVCGIWFLPHAMGKLQHAGLASLTFEKAGFKPGKPFLYATVAAECCAMIGLVTGFNTEFAAALAVLVLGGAAFAVLRINGWNWRWQKQGPEFILFWAVCCVISVL